MDNNITIDTSRFQEISVSYLKKLSGDKLLTFDVLDQQGNTVCFAGQALDDELLKKKSEEGIKFFIPRVTESIGVYDREIIDMKKLKAIADDTATMYTDIRKNGKMTHAQFLQSHNHLAAIVDSLRTEDKTGGVLSLLKDIKDFDYTTYTHSVNVGMLAMILVYKEMSTGDKVKLAALAGYLHDIGKLRVDQSIIQKPGLLSQDEFKKVLEHTREGYRILDSVVDSTGKKVVSNIIKFVALFHHRKLQSPGYPFRDSDKDQTRENQYNELPDLARMIGICDMYDALTSETPFRIPMGAEKALRYILSLSNYLYSTDDIHRFIKVLGLSLNKGMPFLKAGDFIMIESEKISMDTRKKVRVYEVARIEEISRINFMNPKVMIFYDTIKNKKVHNIIVDLRYDSNRRVVRVFESTRIRNMLLRQLKQD
ncbi:MAG: HD domain-containing protein [Spirochaetes bacterium]|nr:HD domain-containing protein [Spirochaetota bacterium]